MIAAISASTSTGRFTRRLLVTLALTLSGCASNHATVALGDGEAHGINCSGADRTWGLCGERAAGICGARGYDVLAAGGGTAAMIETLND